MTEQDASINHDCISRGYLLGIANKDGAYGYVSAHDILHAPCYSLQKLKTDVLGKIRAEINEKENVLDCTKVSDVALKVAYIEVLKIIDKHRQEE